jgi:hypothetical protein
MEYYSVLCSYARESITGETGVGGGGAVAIAREGKRRGLRDNEGLHRDEAVGGQDRGVKEDREGQGNQQV